MLIRLCPAAGNRLVSAMEADPRVSSSPIRAEAASVFRSHCGLEHLFWYLLTSFRQFLAQ